MIQHGMSSALLVLEDGRIFRGV
ncbi:MAG: hypothetical protein K0R87_3013, partial [Pseudonocardia sp.]|nr:hypothetical protein [Pseudonocardia sp.]